MNGLRKYLLILLRVLFSMNLWSLEISLAPLYQYSPEGKAFLSTDITEDLYRLLNNKNAGGGVSFQIIKSEKPPSSILEAASLCTERGKDFLLYGFLKVTEMTYDLEVKLYDKDAGRLQKVFYARNSTDGYKSLAETMAERITVYLDKTFATSGQNRKQEIINGTVDLECGMGYWIPFDPWGIPLAGLGSFYFGGGVTPVEPLFSAGSYAFALRYGAELVYSAGINREGYESFFLHSIGFTIPVGLSAFWNLHNKLIFQISPGLQADVLIQDRLYAERAVEKSAAPTLSVLLGYGYLFPGRRVSLFSSVRFNTVFYTPPLFSAVSSLSIRYRFEGIYKRRRIK